MKIGPGHIPKDAMRPSIHKHEPSGNKAFHEILEEAVREGSVTKSEQAPGLRRPDTLAMPFQVMCQAEKRHIADRLERLLDTLEIYQKALGNRDVSLKDLHPVVSKLENEREDLLAVVDRLPHGDELRTLLDRTLITTTVETMKFLRGDYL